VSRQLVLRYGLEQAFDRPVRLSTHWLRLRPAPGAPARLQAYSLRVRGAPHFINWVRDPFGNHLARLDLPEATTALEIEAEYRLELPDYNPFDFLLDPGVAEYPFDYPEALAEELRPYLQLGAPGPRTQAWLRTAERTPGPTLARLSAWAGALSRAFDDAGPGEPSAVCAETVIARGEATAWERAWLATLALRARGLATRFVCGLRLHCPPAGQAGQHDASLIAWVQVYLPGGGWIGLDPQSGLFTDATHLPLAAATDPLRALPWIGYREACGERARTRILLEPGEPTSPPREARYVSEALWARASATCESVARAARDADLEMVIAPSLSLRADEEGPEWHTQALGGRKQALAAALIDQLCARLGLAPVVQAGQGDWFAGEPAPRWRMTAWWRADGRPVWSRGSPLTGSEREEPDTAEDAEGFSRALAEALGLPAQAVQPAWEDPMQDLWAERHALQYRPGSAELATPEGRAALLDQLCARRAAPAGYVLPLAAGDAPGRWSTGPWSLRRDALYLLPGEAPLGFRLPLDALAESALAPEPPPADPFAPPESLPQGPHGPVAAGGEGQILDHGPRSALCVELRQGRLRVFIPPLRRTEELLHLLAAVEAVALARGLHVALEGYAPPPDARVRRLEIEPDVGCLRLALPGLQDAPAQHELLATVYRVAGELGLEASRLAPDGSLLPCAVGDRIDLAGPDAARSPFLRSPALLGALLRYWQAHPALSFLFAAPPVGQAASAPRVEEGRDDALYELELALARLPADARERPWLADRYLRQLTADVAGDPTRAEFQFDHLYHPQRAERRQGSLRLGGWEALPDARLTAIRLLLLRALVLRLAAAPPGVAAAWGSALRDRFLLPAVLEADLRSVLDELAGAGFDVPYAAFEPWLQARFPVLGRLASGHLELTLRPALEPWPLLAETASGGGTARFIDVANTRVEFRLRGLTPGRHAVLCNGRRLPLQPMATAGEAVAGLRFKASDPPATLHPGLPVTERLDLELLDLRSGRILDRGRYIPARSLAPGPVAAPPEALPGTDPQTRQPPRPAGVQGGQPGRFERLGPGGRREVVPGPQVDPRQPYSLDLTAGD
jgi:uncharacterized protein (DUF2126 family)